MSAGRSEANFEDEDGGIRSFYRSSRRQWLTSAVILAVGSSLAGCYESGQKATESEQNEANTAALAAFWALRLPAVASPGVSEVVLAAFRGRPLLVNFWATWCPPCVMELPLLSHFYAGRGTRDWQCLGLAVEDQREPVARFLAHSPVTYPVALAGLAGVQISQSLGNTNGGLPFTVFFDAKMTIKYSKTGQLQPSDLNSWLG
jgi:hypothetical protein